MTESWLYGPPSVTPGRTPVGASRRAPIPPREHAVRVSVPPAAGRIADVWVPAGPSTTLDRPGTDGLRTAGRVRALAVSPDATRVYAGSALGGLWYSGDSGKRWRSLDHFESTKDAGGTVRDANALAVGAVAVRFVDASNDLVLVGPGERPPWPPIPDALGLAGAGIRVRTGPVAAVQAAGPAADPWVLEATNLTGSAVSRLVFDRVTGDVVWAATSKGLFRRPVAPGDRGSWTAVDAGLGATWVSDVVTVPGLGAEPQRIYAVSAAGHLVRSTDGTTWQAIALPPVAGVASSVPLGRLVLAAGNDPARPVVWVLGGGPRLWRVDADTAEPVVGLPPDLFGTGTDDDLALAVHPSTAAGQRDLIAVGGSSAGTSGGGDAALYSGVVTQVAGVWTFPRTAPSPVPPAPAGPPGTSGPSRGEWIGSGIHPGVHALSWIGTAAPAQLWVGGEGGVYRSLNDGRRGSFLDRNTGLADLRSTLLAAHDRLPGLMLLGSNDNGTLRALGGTTWRSAGGIDAGGVAIDPSRPARMYRQEDGASWFSSVDAGQTFAPMAVMSTAPPGAAPAQAQLWTSAREAEERRTAAVSAIAVVAVETTPAGTQVALGTNRIWYRDDATDEAARVAGKGTGWVTLPTATDPYGAALTAPATTQDILDASVLGLAWAGPNLLYVLTRTSVYALRRTPGSGAVPSTWAAPAHLYDQATVRRNWKGKVPSGDVPPDARLVGLAVHDPAHGASGSVYLGVAGDRDGHGLWWFDGAGHWHDTRLTFAFSPIAAVNAVVVDPLTPTVVYAGTDLGVYRGVGTFPAADDPSWVWAQYSAGLPEAGCTALSIRSVADAGPRLLRAALAGRGVWEVPIDGSLQGPTAYLRAHDLDLRRATMPLGGPEDPASRSRTQVRLDASPDIRLWRADTTGPPVPAHLPIGPTSPAYDVWLLQSALRAGGEAVAVDGIWSAAVATALTSRIAALTPPLPAGPTPQQVWTAIWAGNRLPFQFTPPDNADLIAHLRERPDTGPKGALTSCVADDGVARIFVTVHGRHWEPLVAARVQVALLKAEFGRHGNLAATPPLPAGWAAALAADSAAPPGGAWLAGSAWSYVDPATPMRAVPDVLDADNPQVVSFDADLSGPAWIQRGWLLLAIVVAADDLVVSTETDVARLVATSQHVAARSVRRAHARVEVPGVVAPLFAGMDQSDYPGLATMNRGWERSNLAFTGLYLDSPLPVAGEVPVPAGVLAGHNRLGGTAGHAAGAWMHAWTELWPDWGIAPIYWGQQGAGNPQGPFDLRTIIAAANAEDAAAKATTAQLPPGSVIYIDWEVPGLPSPDGISYLRTFWERLAEFGYRAGVYAHPPAAAALRRECPGLFTWQVSCQQGDCSFQPAVGATTVDGRLQYATPPAHPTDPDALTRQWAFNAAQPPASPMAPFPNIDPDSGVVGDPALPERLPQPALIRGGSVAVSTSAGADASVIRVLRGRPVRATWAPGAATRDTLLDLATAAHWWNPFAPSVATPVPVSAAAGAPSADWAFGLGYERTVGEPAWRVQAMEYGPSGWRVTTVPDGGFVVDPLAGVTAAARVGGSVEVLVIASGGTPVAARLDAGPRVWSGLTPVAVGAGDAARPSSRPALVWQAPDVLDAIWLGADGRLRAARSTVAGTWGAPELIADPTVAVHPLGNIAAVASAADQVDVAYLGRTGGAGPWKLYVTSWRNGPGWVGSNIAAGAGIDLSPLSRIGVASRAAGIVDVFAVAATGGLVVTSRPAAAGAWTALAAIGGAPAVGAGHTLRVASIEGCVSTTAGGLSTVVSGREGGVWASRRDPGTGAWTVLERLGPLDPV